MNTIQKTCLTAIMRLIENEPCDETLSIIHDLLTIIWEAEFKPAPKIPSMPKLGI